MTCGTLWVRKKRTGMCCCTIKENKKVRLFTTRDSSTILSYILQILTEVYNKHNSWSPWFFFSFSSWIHVVELRGIDSIVSYLIRKDLQISFLIIIKKLTVSNKKEDADVEITKYTFSGSITRRNRILLTFLGSVHSLRKIENKSNQPKKRVHL